MISLWKIIVSGDMLGGYFHNYKLEDKIVPRYFFYLFDKITEKKLLVGYWHPEEKKDKNFIILRNTKLKDSRFNFFAGIESDYEDMERIDFEEGIEKYLKVNLEDYGKTNSIEVDDLEFIDYLSFHSEADWSPDKLFFDYYKRFVREMKESK